MKYLRTFDTKSEYKTAKKNHSLVIPNVSYIKSDRSVYVTSAFSTKYNAETGDIAAYSKETYETWAGTSDNDAKKAAFQRMLESVKFIKPEFYTKDIAKQYIPDSIVVVPYSHTNDGKVRVMSLNYMDPSSPINGTLTPTAVVWGNSVDIQDITNYNGVVKLNAPSLGKASGLSSVDNTRLPSDVFTTLEVPNSDTDYYWSSTETYNSPCPYNSDGSLNKQFLGYDSTTDTSLTDNVFLDRDGLANTKAILNSIDKTCLESILMGDTISNVQQYTYSTKTVTTYTYTEGSNSVTVMTATDIDGTVTYTDVNGNVLTQTMSGNTTTYNNESGVTVVTATTTGSTTTYVDGDNHVLTAKSTTTESKTSVFPAAMCCQRYSSVLSPNTVSVSDGKFESWGDWYLPSAGELAYYLVGRGRITYAIARINDVKEFTNVPAAPYHNDWLWSSSEWGNSHAWGLRPSDGTVSNLGYGKNYGCRVRAFAAF